MKSGQRIITRAVSTPIVSGRYPLRLSGGAPPAPPPPAPNEPTLSAVAIALGLPASAPPEAAVSTGSNAFALSVKSVTPGAVAPCAWFAFAFSAVIACCASEDRWSQ